MPQDTIAPAQPAASRPSESALSLRLPSLDGWRALSIALVLRAHFHYTRGYPGFLDIFRMFDGELGVRCFFVISGFLITWLLIGENDRAGGISLKHFYIRRALRILPVYFAFMAVLWALHLFTPFNQSRGAWIANATFTTDFFQTSFPSSHLWSLSVEEQFYLLWPFLFSALALANKPRFALGVLTVPLVIAPIWRVITYKQWYSPALHPLFSLFSFFNFFDCLAIGCLCAVVLRHHRAILETWLVNRPKRMASLALAAIVFPYLEVWLHFPGRIVAGSTASLQAFGFAVVLLQSVMLPGRGIFPALNWNWVRHLGVLSYSIYIWQQIFCARPEIFGLGPVWYMSFPGGILSVLLVAHASYYLLERPLFQLRSRFR